MTAKAIALPMIESMAIVRIRPMAIAAMLAAEIRAGIRAVTRIVISGANLGANKVEIRAAMTVVPTVAMASIDRNRASAPPMGGTNEQAMLTSVWIQRLRVVATAHVAVDRDVPRKR